MGITWGNQKEFLELVTCVEKGRFAVMESNLHVRIALVTESHAYLQLDLKEEQVRDKCTLSHSFLD